MYAALCVQVAAFYLVARLEERELRLRFGDRHAAYVASTPSLIFPSLFGEMPSALVRKRAEDVRRAEADKNGFGGGGGMDETLFDVVGEEELEPPRAPTATRPSPRPKPTIPKPRAAAVVAPPTEITEVVEDAFVDGEHVADATAPRLAPSPPEREGVVALDLVQQWQALAKQVPQHFARASQHSHISAHSIPLRSLKPYRLRFDVSDRVFEHGRAARPLAVLGQRIPNGLHVVFQRGDHFRGAREMIGRGLVAVIW